MVRGKVLYKDKANIKQRTESVQINNLNELSDIVQNSSPNSVDRKTLLWLDSIEPDPTPHNPDHRKCDYKSGSDSEKETEKRICRCMYYYNKGDAQQAEVCKKCVMEWKSRINRSDYEILDYEVPMPTVTENVGGIDLLVQDVMNPEKVCAVEVKPEDSKETLARMMAEILTYCEITGYKVANNGKTLSVKPAICFFEGSKQYNDYLKLKDLPAVKNLLTEITVFSITYDDNSFTIVNAADAGVNKHLTSRNRETQIVRPRSMSQKERFDLIIKQNLIRSDKCGETEECFGYHINNSDYDFYYKEEEFTSFIDEMRSKYPEHFLKYAGDETSKENKGGVGGELEVKKTGYGYAPPKMAHVASSSRFCYLALRGGTDALVTDKVLKKENIEFEKECRIFDSGHAPQLDAYIADEDMNVYVEVKCHEIFDRHTPTFKNKYWKYFKEDKVFNCAAIEDDKCKETFTVPLSMFGLSCELKSTMLDIKQMVCHLMGIARQNNGKKAKLVYLFFKPECNNLADQEFVDNVFEHLQNEINVVFKSGMIPEFCAANNIELEAIAEESAFMCKLEKGNVINLVVNSNMAKA